MISRQPPVRLYKYKSFNSQTLDMLVEDKAYFADPGMFNDPLDVKPVLVADLDKEKLQAVYMKMVEDRVVAKSIAASKVLRASGDKLKERISRLARATGQQLITDLKYYAKFPESGSDEAFLLTQGIQDELRFRYDKGVLSLSENLGSPLMWSHYADQHKGVCLGFSVPSHVATDARRVHYGVSRSIKASDVAEMLQGDQVAVRKVDEAVLLRKARAWSYEREWRMIGMVGEQDSPLELEEVVFGMRCSDSAQYTVVKALDGRRPPIKFSRMYVRGSSFRLYKCAVDVGELCSSRPRRSLDIYDHFDFINEES